MVDIVGTAISAVRVKKNSRGIIPSMVA